jgi:hypothetical protein
MRPFNEGESFLNLVKQAVPDFVETDYPVFVEFIKAFVAFLEQKRQTTTVGLFPDYGSHPTKIQRTDELGGPLYETRKFFDYRDIETTLDDFLTHFISMYGKSFPVYSYIPKALFLQSLRELYERKGTVPGFQWFFRAFFNIESEIAFPRDDVLRASDGTWIQPITLKVSAAIGQDNSNVGKYYIGQRVKTATGTAIVENVLTTVVGQQFSQFVIVNEVYLKAETIQGIFLPGQHLVNIDTPQFAVETIILPVISGITINSGGSNYVAGDIIKFSEGPSGGYGYGALGKVKQVNSTSLNTVKITDGGDGYLVGDPVKFISTSGTGATGVVSEIVYGDWLAEDSTFILNEHQTPDGTDRIVLEDRNTLILELIIDPFCNSTAVVPIDSADYGIDSGVVQLEGTDIDTAIEVFLAAVDEKPFMHPWVFTNAVESVAKLANVEVTVALSTNTFFANTDHVFTILGPTDVVTDIDSSSVSANVIISDISLGNNQNILFLHDINDINKFHNSVYVKANGTGVVQEGKVVCNGSANVVGTDTEFAKVLHPNTHIRFSDGTQAVVKTVVNNTFLSVYGASTPVLVANTYSIIPTGLVTQFIPEAQRFYGKITKVRLLTQGHGYLSPPFVTADSISARAQQLYYLQPNTIPVDTQDPLNAVVGLNDQVTLFKQAIMGVGQDSGQIVKVSILNAGVNYTDANSISIEAIHGQGRTGENADLSPILGALTHYPGTFTTSKGFVSSDKYLQDSTYYNDFVYVVKVGESMERYRKMLLQLLHPAGFRMMGRVVISDVATLNLNPQDFNPDYAPGEAIGLIIIGGGGLANTQTDMLYIINLGESTQDRTRTTDTPDVPESSLFVPIDDYLTLPDYETAMEQVGMEPRFYWPLSNTSLISNGTSNLELSGTTTFVSDDGPLHIFSSHELDSGVSYTFSDANTELFAGRSDGDKQFRGTLVVWFKPLEAYPNTEMLLFGDSANSWLRITADQNGVVHGYIGIHETISSKMLTLNDWNMIALSYSPPDSDINETFDPDLNAGEMKLYLNGRIQDVVKIPS